LQYIQNLTEQTPEKILIIRHFPLHDLCSLPKIILVLKEGKDERGVWNEWERREIPRNLFGKIERKR
jgi:hypothetical protein